MRVEKGRAVGVDRKRLFSKIVSLLAPALSFIYGIAMLAVVPQRELSYLSAVLAFSQMVGALGGIGLGLFHSMLDGRPTVQRNVLDVSAVGIVAGLVPFAVGWGFVESALVVSSFAATYSDTWYKKFSPPAIVLARGCQSAAWGAVILWALLQHSASAIDLIVGRAVCCTVMLVGLVKNVDQAPSTISVKLRPAALRASQTWVWMLGSNGIFLLPPILVNKIYEIGPVAAFWGYLLQLSLQAGGRLSDYMTVQGRLGHVLGAKERIALSVCPAVLIIFSVSLRSDYLSLMSAGALAVALSLISIAAVLWGRADAHVVLLLLDKPSRAPRASVSSLCGLLVTMGLISICAALPPRGVPIGVAAAVFLGCSAYFWCSRVIADKGLLS